MTNVTPTIQLKGISKFFGNIIALKDISFEANRGQVTALLGDNDAGKSTLIKVLSGVPWCCKVCNGVVWCCKVFHSDVRCIQV